MERLPGLFFYALLLPNKSILRVECARILVYNYHMQMRISRIKEERPVEACHAFPALIICAILYILRRSPESELYLMPGETTFILLLHSTPSMC